ncbi:hypothetical protein VTL71DRAFT_14050 [Oculimacula yallundae]|uniref:Uncharacterized protein n=1 Tax=Oculimacula yallundae TaxID=86028 RepID=A0ABR4CML9_9HELO
MACRLESLVHPGSIWPADSNPAQPYAPIESQLILPLAIKKTRKAT